MISLIAAIDELGGLGKNNQLLCHLPIDLKYFKSVTLGKPVIMGRKTYESIGRPLPNRPNIVLSHTAKNIPGVTIASSIEEVFKLTQDASEIMVIGGAELFKQFLPQAQQLYLTRIHHIFDADVFFPILDWSEWELISSEAHVKDIANPYNVTFECYKKISKKS